MQYSPEEKLDIEERSEKASQFLKELELTPQALISANNLGGDTFGFKVQIYLQDLKYKKEESVKSPLSDELTKKD